MKHTRSEHKTVKSVNDEKKQNLKDYQCEFCDKFFTSRQNLNRHVENIHGVEKKAAPTIECFMCNQHWKTMAMLDKHLSESHNIVLKEGEIDFDSIEGN